MGKLTKLTVRYELEQMRSVFENADENDLRVLVGVMMLAGKNGGVAATSELPELVGLEKTDIDASLKFWRGAGILRGAKAGSEKTAEQTGAAVTAPKSGTQAPSASAAPGAHRNGALEQSGALGTYSSEELAELMEQRRVTAQFVDEAQRVMGKIFRAYDTGILVGMVDRLGFEEEAVLTILTYVAGRGKKTLRYAEQLALALYDEGITDTAEVTARISRMERAGETISRIKVLFGVGERELTTTEKRLFGAWTEKFAYDIGVIRLAYDLTVDAIQKPVPKYTNSILESWHAAGLRTEEEVRSYLEGQAAQKQGAVSAAKSYDVTDFFEAALQRSYEEIQ